MRFNSFIVPLVVVVSLFLLFMNNFKIGSLNLNGSREMKKRATVYELIRLKCLDVLLVQETHSDVGNTADWN